MASPDKTDSWGFLSFPIDYFNFYLNTAQKWNKSYAFIHLPPILYKPTD